MTGARQITLTFVALHLVVAALIPLIADETYYALWASVPDWDYYDHPPMIAWLIHLGGAVFGTSPFGVRVVPVLAMGGASLLVADTARLMGLSAPGQARAVLFFNLSLLVLGVGSFATPDAPSTLFWMLSTWAALRATQGEGARWWAVAGLAAGLGIMSKFTNLFLGVGYLGWLLTTLQGRRSLRGAGPYLAVLGAIIPVVPLILWNLSHDMLGFERQFGRIAEGAFTARHVVTYLALLVVLPTPVIGGLALFGLRRPLPALALWSVGPLLVYFLFHALHAQVQANWLIPVSGVVAILAAHGAEGLRPLWARVAWISGAVLSFGLLGAAFNPWTPLGVTDNPPNQTRGWPATDAALTALIASEGAAWVATTDYSLTGQLWVRLPGVPVYSMTDLNRYGFRGTFPVALCAATGLLVEDRTDLSSTLFTQSRPVGEVARTQAGHVLARYQVHVVSGVKDPALCPAP